MINIGIAAGDAVATSLLGSSGFARVFVLLGGQRLSDLHVPLCEQAASTRGPEVQGEHMPAGAEG